MDFDRFWRLLLLCLPLLLLLCLHMGLLLLLCLHLGLLLLLLVLLVLLLLHLLLILVPGRYGIGRLSSIASGELTQTMHSSVWNGVKQYVTTEGYCLPNLGALSGKVTFPMEVSLLYPSSASLL